MPQPAWTRKDFAHSPFLVFYEITRACDLVCQHCRACAQPRSHPHELTTEQSFRLIDQIATFPNRPLLVLTGGDPIKRADVYELIRHAVGAGLEVAMTPSATPLVTADAIRRLRDAGLRRLAVSLDGADAATHDAFRGVPGTFDRAMRMLEDCRQIGLPTQVNTTITRGNVHQVDAMARMLAALPAPGISLWSVFFLIPVGRGLREQCIAPALYEAVFERLWYHAQRQPFAIKTTEAHHYRRYVLQHGGNPQSAPGGPAKTDKPQRHEGHKEETAGKPTGLRAPLGVNDGNGVMFVSHVGEIYPSGFMPILCGRFPQNSVVDVYQHSEVFQSLRDADRLGGKCGQCEYRQICGGSRARAYTVTGDPLAAEPDCVYQPKTSR